MMSQADRIVGLYERRAAAWTSAREAARFVEPGHLKPAARSVNGEYHGCSIGLARELGVWAWSAA